jgi:hypothetical protein
MAAPDLPQVGDEVLVAGRIVDILDTGRQTFAVVSVPGARPHLGHIAVPLHDVQTRPGGWTPPDLETKHSPGISSGSCIELTRDRVSDPTTTEGPR